MIGKLFGYTHNETTETDIILTLTPRIVRVLNLTAEDLQPFRVPRDGGATGGIDIAPPLPIPLPLPLPKPPGSTEDATAAARPRAGVSDAGSGTGDTAEAAGQAAEGL